MALQYYQEAISLIETIRAKNLSASVRADFFATISDIFAHAILLCMGMGREVEAFAYIEQARSRAFLDMLTAGTDELPPDLETKTITLPEVQKNLLPYTVILEYFTTGELSEQVARTGKQTERHRAIEEKTLLFVITSKQFDFHEIDVSPNELPSTGFLKQFKKSAFQERLYQSLLKPVEDVLQHKKRLYLIPHGPLHKIPFQPLLTYSSLPSSHEFQLVHALSATLLMQNSLPNKTELPPKGCLAVGYNSEEVRLEVAESEAQNIANLMQGMALIGDMPKKERLYQQAQAYQYLHFACHGEFNPETPLQSRLHIGPDEYLTASEVIEHLKLQAKLVTLSACETGRNEVRRGDELMGFVRAFMYAGARAVIVSLWKIHDEPTKRLMETLYQGIHEGLDISTALKQAQNELRTWTDDQGVRKYQDPYHWAGFRLIGPYGM